MTPESSSSTIEQTEILDLLSSFVDKSLVVYDESSCRYRLLETVRQYALDRLMESGEGMDIRRRHLFDFLSIAEEASPHLKGEGQREWLERLEVEHENLRSAMDYCAGNLEFSEAGLRLAGSLGRFWIMRGHVVEGRRRCANALSDNSALNPSIVLARGLHEAGNLAYVNSDLSGAKEFYQQAASMRHDLGDLAGEAGSLGNLATIAQTEGDIEFARLQFEKTLAIFQDLGNSQGIAVSLGCLGSVLRDHGDLAGARDYFKRAIELNRKMGDRAAEANSLNNLGAVEKDTGNGPAARIAYERALKVNRELGYDWEAALNLINLGIFLREEGRLDVSKAYLAEALRLLVKVGSRRDIAECLGALAGLEALRSLPVRAARLLGASVMCREEVGSKLAADDQKAVQSLIAKLRQTIGDSEFEQEYSLGRSMSVDQAIAFALQESADG